jgi:hypothetical protein
VNLPDFFTYGPGDSWGFFVGGGRKGEDLPGESRIMGCSNAMISGGKILMKFIQSQSPLSTEY